MLAAIRPRRPSPVRDTVLLAAGALLVLTGCAGGDGGGSSGPRTSLVIAVATDDGADPTTYELTCDPVGGDHPQAKEACAVLDQAGASIFDPVPKDQACTMIYGGPQTATVKGTYGGEDVDAAFSRANGCEIDRWEELGTTFFDVPLQ